MREAAVQREEIPDEGDYALVARGAELCNPFLDAMGEVTLSIRGPIASSVLNWNASLFTPIIHPTLLKVVTLATEGGSFELTALDCVLDKALPSSVRLTSRDEGKRLLLGLLAPRGDRVIERYRAAVQAGNSPGHFAITHALRANLFHLPPRVMVASYLMQEGVGAGMDGRDISRFLIDGIGAAVELPGTEEIRPMSQPCRR